METKAVRTFGGGGVRCFQKCCTLRCRKIMIERPSVHVHKWKVYKNDPLQGAAQKISADAGHDRRTREIRRTNASTSVVYFVCSSEQTYEHDMNHSAKHSSIAISTSRCVTDPGDV